MNIKMYTKVECIWCDRAKNILDEYELQYLEIDISDDIIRKKFYQEVGEGDMWRLRLHCRCGGT